MDTFHWQNPKLMNIVFENRHKAYGAYALRLEYEKRMSRAILISVFIFLSAMTALLWLSVRNAVATVLPEEHVIIFEDFNYIKSAIKPPTPIKIVDPVQAVQAQIKHVPPRVVNDDVTIVEVPVPTQSEILENNIGTSNVTAVDGTIDQGMIVESSTDGTEIEAAPDGPVAMYMVQQKPEFPDGEAAMYAYIRKNLKYPEMAQQTGLTGTVVVQFVINTTGEVEKVVILKSPAGVFNQPAMSVIQHMPRWKPGKINGKPVSVLFTLPLKFQLM